LPNCISRSTVVIGAKYWVLVFLVGGWCKSDKSKAFTTLVSQLTLLNLNGIIFAMWSFRCILNATSITLLRCHPTTFVWLRYPLAVLTFTWNEWKILNWERLLSWN
jgi:hypothetical protein